ncbi:radial spoke head protein 9 homolog [Anthonomus grandis grandis]|uniref:radial spoke head protein 9 homolog n=1 Tax=Anthonomus grandis grandis TaxID=2921223 RepID=UPI0021667A71|nr:radial spoke head protein 9 homolog [Anthonomus grandis grandis]
MNIESLLECLSTIGHYGHIVSTEEQIVLQNSLLILQNENHFRNVFLWGKILGADKDYYVAYGYVKDVLYGKIYYYSTNCVDWGLLPQPTKNGLLLTPLCTTRFQGDPALVIDVLIEKEETWFLEEKFKGPQLRKLKEEDRLAALVHLITKEAAVVPRGVNFQRPDGVVVENLSFEGLSALEAREISSFQHDRAATQKYNTNLLTRDDYNYAMDFLDPLDIDIPEGSWIIQIAAGETLVLLKCLFWPGLVFFHVLKTRKHGFVYIGNGKRCIDLPFMLSPFS